MITITEAPVLISFAGNPILYKVQGQNLVSFGSRAYFEMIINSFDMAAGRIFMLNFGSYSLCFVSSANPQYDGLQFRVAEVDISTNPDAFAANIFETFSINYDLQRFYHVTLGPTGINQRKIFFEAKNIGSCWSLSLTDVAVVGVTEGMNTPGINNIEQDCFTFVGLLRDGQGKLIGEDRCIGDSGTAVFNFEDYLSSYFSLKQDPRFEFPEAVGFVVQHSTDFVVPYKASFAESVLGVVKGLVTDSIRYAIPGGLSRELLASLNSKATDYFSLDANKRRFLSWLPLSKRSRSGIIEKLFFLFQDDPSLQMFQLMTIVTFTDGTVKVIEQTTQAPVIPYSVIECKVSFDHLDLVNAEAGKTVDFWEVLLVDQDGEPISEIRRFINDTSFHINPKAFFFRNSFSAYDTFLFRGKSDVSLEYERSSGSFIKEEKFSFFNAPSRQFDSLETFSCKTNSGWLTLEEKNYLRELLLSSEVYENVGKELFQVVVKTAKVSSFLKDGDFLYNLEIEYERAYQNSFYSFYQIESSSNPVQAIQPLTWDNIEVSFDDVEITFDQIEY